MNCTFHLHEEVGTDIALNGRESLEATMERNSKLERVWEKRLGQNCCLEIPSVPL
jgi:hypothetical protein